MYNKTYLIGTLICATMFILSLMYFGTLATIFFGVVLFFSGLMTFANRISKATYQVIGEDNKLIKEFKDESSAIEFADDLNCNSKISMVCVRA